jgi:hypothetical protein
MRTPVLAACLMLLAGVAAAEQIVSTPRAAKLPITAVNRPFLEARSALEPVALGARGYVEEEVQVSGLANVYEWADIGARPPVHVRNPNVPYTTRVLVRRPADRQKASGRVVVELLDPAAQYDRAPLWGLSAEHFLRGGDIWVGVTVHPAAAAVLQRFDGVRYAQLAFAFTQAPDCTLPSPRTETGLAWDILAQVGALLRSSSKENPLVTFDLRRVVAAGQGLAGSYLVTYANALHAEKRLGDGRPVFDAYVSVDAAEVAPINQCAAPLPDGDARRGVGARDVPFVSVVTQTALAATLDRRRSDSDEAGDTYRLFEVAGAAQGPVAPAGQPGVADLKIAGFEPAAPLCAEARNDLPLAPVLNAVWQQLDERLLAGTPLARATPIDVLANGAPVPDASGNARGGWRSPAIDLPLAVYGGRGTAKDPADAAAVAACGLNGSKRPLDSAELRTLYGTRAEYLKRFGAAVDTAVQERRLVPADAAALKAQAARIAPAF